MGSSHTKYEIIPKPIPATKEEILNTNGMRMFKGYGGSEREAVDNLTIVCNRVRIPKPEYNKENKVYCCGHILVDSIDIFDQEKNLRLNPVFIANRDQERWSASVHYLDV
jgi:hypothetical protein